MLTLLTPDQGRVDVLARGCRRPKSPLLPASELFVHGEFVLFQTGDRYVLTACSLTDTFFPLRLDHDRLTCAAYLLGLCQAAAQPGEDASELYSLLLQGLYRLAYDEKENPMGSLSSFLLLFADILGYKPRMNHCAHCRVDLDLTQSTLLDIPAGGFVCPACGAKAAYRISAEQAQWMRDTLQMGFSKEGQQNTGAPEMVSVLRRYVESRLETTIKAGQLLP